MKKSLLLLAAVWAAFCPPPAQAEVYWVEGIKWDGKNWHTATGWVDNDKNYEWVDGHPTGGDDGDNELCWAASASNLITWWQHQNPEAAAAAGAPTEAEEIWKVFKNSYKDAGGFTNEGVKWWFLGDKPSAPQQKPGAAAAGYYSSLVEPEVKEDLYGYIGYEDPRYYYPSSIISSSNPSEYSGNALQDISFSIKELIQAGYGLGLHIAVAPKNSDILGGGHAITLWGIDYNEELNRLEKLYVTDSDDPQWEQEGLFELTLSPLGRELYVTEYDAKSGISPNEFFTLTSSDTAPDGQLVYQGQFVLYGYTWLNSAIPMNLTIAPVPEPSSALLALFTLAAAATRRRRC